MPARIADAAEVILELGLSASITEEERAIVGQCIPKAEAAVRTHLKYDPVRATRTEFYPRADTSPGRYSTVMDVNATSAFEKQISGRASQNLQLQHIPVRSITNLYIDYDGRHGQKSGAFGSGSEKTLGTDFWMQADGTDDSGNAICWSGILVSGGIWPQQSGSIKVIYIAGFSDDEFRGASNTVNATPIWEVVIDEACRRVQKIFAWKKKSLGGLGGGVITSETLGSYSRSIDTALLSREIGGMAISATNQEKLNDFVHYGV